VLIHPGDSEPVEQLDGLLLTGGSDVNSTFRRNRTANDKPMTSGMPWNAAEWRQRICSAAICRGIHCASSREGAGGTAVQPSCAHPIGVEAGTRLAQAIGPGKHLVNSRHHQIVDQTGPGLRVSARSEEGYPEALERDDKKFAVAVQWHPEDLVDNHEEAKRLFQAFADSL
jgi:putative glutamine amidotransferase